jgi:hypothetical protein
VSDLLSEVAKKRLAQAVKEAGKAPSSSERVKIQHMLMPIANHIATRLLYTEVSLDVVCPAPVSFHCLEQST